MRVHISMMNLGRIEVTDFKSKGELVRTQLRFVDKERASGIVIDLPITWYEKLLAGIDSKQIAE